MSIVYKCDRCGKDLHEMDRVLFKIYEPNDYGTLHDAIDRHLCRKCYQVFMDMEWKAEEDGR